VMRALVANGVQRVVWVTLNETEGVWKQSNEIIRAAPARWPQLAVADWGGTVQLDPSWFRDDEVHFSHDGAVAYGKFLRPIVLTQVELVADTLPPVMHLPAAIHARATSAKGRVIRIEPVAVDAKDGVVPVTCTPTSPHLFPVGRTYVTCSATDAAGNETSGGFDVFVTGARKRAAAH
jgi:HYR domain